ncbi:MAG: metallopeptidase TldD-related protein [Erysipelotrichaceae bacterium]|nr:metallopeptidase TldD-related protein [Erysipelotrichaceae bacterium]
MSDRLIELLKVKADGYKIINTTTRAHEFFFIKHKLDMNRYKDVEHTLLTVYKKDKEGKYLGSTTREIHPYLKNEELEMIIDQMVYSAQFVKNPYYELVKPEDKNISDQLKVDPLEVAKDIIMTIQATKETPITNINSYEVFVNEKIINIKNSLGVDVTYHTLDSQAEIIVNAKLDDQEIEIYRNYTFGTCDKEYLSQQLHNTLQIGIDRSKAVPTNNLKQFRVVFTDHNAIKLLNYFIDMTNVSSIYMKISDYQKGETIAEFTGNDRIGLSAKAKLFNSSKNHLYDEDGNLLCDRELISDGVGVDYWGNQQFSQYVGKSKASNFKNFVFAGGSFDQLELKRSPYLKAVEFSDFQCDSATGNFAGEIRLAYYFDGDKEIPVTGGSISGNIRQLQKQMRLAKDLKQIDNYLIPEYVVLDDVVVSGIN